MAQTNRKPKTKVQAKAWLKSHGHNLPAQDNDPQQDLITLIAATHKIDEAELRRLLK